MNWDRAKHLLRIASLNAAQASAPDAEAADDRIEPRGARVEHERALRDRCNEPRELSVAPAAHGDRAGVDSASIARASSLCIVSGKGGTGKSVVSASLATLLAARGRTLIVDADMGVGNAHILQDIVPEHSFVEVVEGHLEVRDIRANCRAGLDLVGAGSGVSRMAGLDAHEMHVIACGLEELELEYRHVVIDSAAGISNQTVAFAAASDVVLIVTTPDVTALTDAYAFLKVLLQRKPDCTPLFVVNRAASDDEGRHVADRLRAVAHKFLGREPRFAGSLPDDRAVVRSVNQRAPVVVSEPDSPAAHALRALELIIERELARVPARGIGRSLLATVGHSPGMI